MSLERRQLVSEYTPEDRKGFLAVLFRMARADDVSAAERDVMQPIADWMNASDQELEEAMQRAYDLSKPLSELARQHKSAFKGMLLFREACAVVWVDGRKTESEHALLDELRSALGLSDMIVSVLDSPLACSPEGERRFLELLIDN